MEQTQTRRAPILALAAVLAATTLTGAAAVMGLDRHATPVAPATASQPAASSPAPATGTSWSDD